MAKMTSPKFELIIDNMAELAHEIWSNWYTHQRDDGNDENIERWNRQAETKYKFLSEEDKEKDREVAIKYVRCFLENCFNNK
jgi:hypothetical protein